MPLAHPQALPGYDKATIHPDKLRKYALDPSSEKGANKARLFAAILGYTVGNADELEIVLKGGSDVQDV